MAMPEKAMAPFVALSRPMTADIYRTPRIHSRSGLLLLSSWTRVFQAAASSGRPGCPQTKGNIRRGFRQITRAAGLGEDWVPRELRHTFVSIMSAGGVPVEEIARLAGHQQTSTTELVYRRELRPVIATGAEIMDRIFSS
jgi:integrase